MDNFFQMLNSIRPDFIPPMGGIGKSLAKGNYILISALFLALCSCSNNAPANALSITVTNRRPEPQKLEMILQATEPKKELHKVKGEVAANYSEQFTVPGPAEKSGPMKLIVQTADGKGTTILLDETRWKKPFTVTLNRERKIEVSEE